MKTENFIFYPDNMPHVDFFTPYKKKSALLIQIFFGTLEDLSPLSALLKTIKKELPKAIVIGASTDGEIIGDKIIHHSISLSISSFDKTKLKAFSVEGANSYENGKLIARKLISSKTKLLIAFNDGTSSNGEEFLHGVNEIAPHVPVAGGMAGDNATFTQTFILYGTTIFQQGAVAVAFEGEALHVNQRFSFDWQALGNAMTVTLAKGNRVYTINDIKAVDIYKKYLGEETKELLPHIGIEFPLIITKNGQQYARAALQRFEDGSLAFAGNIETGDTVHIGFGNASYILQNSTNQTKDIAKLPVESIFLYSCMARKRFMPDEIALEITPLSKLAPTAGFFTYGEFYHKLDHNFLFNQTLTIVTLSESNHTPKHKPLQTQTLLNSDHQKTLRALSHLFKVSQQELELNQRILEKAMQIGHVSYFAYDNELGIATASKEAKALFGFEDAKEFFQPNYLKPFLLQGYEKQLERINQAIKEKEPYEISCQIKTNGGIKHITITLEVLQESQGHIQTLLGTINDITTLALQESRNKELAYLLEHSISEIYIMDVKTLRYIYANQTAIEKSQYSMEELLERTVFDLNPWLTQERAQQMVDALNQKASITNISWHQRKDGSTYPVSAYIQKTTFNQKDVIVVFDNDVTKETQEREKLLSLQKTFQAIMDNSSSLMFVFKEGEKINANRAFLDFFGFKTLEEFTQTSACIISRFVELEEHIKKSNLNNFAFFESITKNGRLIRLKNEQTQVHHTMKVTIDNLPDKQKLITFHDVSDLEEKSRRQAYLATHDALTGVYNRRYFEELFEHSIKLFEREQSTFSLILFDIDNFKLINDTYGHLKGDEVLKSLSHFVSDNIRKSDTLARWGGEEFIILLPHTTIDKASHLAQTLREGIEELFFEEIGHITCSFGVNEVSTESKELIFKELDLALYKAKSNGKNCVVKAHDV